MKNIWVSFCCVLFFSATMYAFLRGEKSSAQERGPAAASGLKSTVPMSKEMEIALERKKAGIELQERELKLQQKRLEEESLALTSKIQDLENLMKEKEAFEAEKAKVRSDDFSKIVKTYEKMPPKKAADVISAMEDNVAVEILKQLKEKPLAGILASMAPDRAMNLTSKLASRVPASACKVVDQSQK